MKFLSNLIWIVLLAVSEPILSQNHKPFDDDKFPIHVVDSSIVNRRGLDSIMVMLNSRCDWSSRVGKKVDVFWIKSTNKSLFGHIYEYFMDCDNLRFIYWYNSPKEGDSIIDFMVEPLEENSKFVTSSKKHLKNKKKYKKYL